MCEEKYEERVFPCIALRGVSIFPNTVVHFDIGREKSIKALEKAMADDKLLFVATQEDEDILIPTFNDVYNFGTLVKVKQMLKIQGDAVRVLVEGIARAYITMPISEESYLACHISVLEEHLTEEDMTIEDKAAMRVMIDQFLEYAQANQISNETIDKVLNADSPIDVLDRMANELLVHTSVKQKVLETMSFSQRIAEMTSILAEENSIAAVEREIAQKVKENVDNNQKEYFLREKIKAIQEELGVAEDAGVEAAEWIEALDKLKLPRKT